MSNGFFAVQKNLIDEGQRTALIDEILQSDYFGESALGAEFVNTRGFSLVLKRPALEAIGSDFPCLSALLKQVLFEECNAFYINPLVLYGNSRVDAHIDCRVVAPHNTRIIPNLVSVYYPDIDPTMAGGRLVLNTGSDHEAPFTPETGDLIHFLGSVVHHVEAVTQPVRRISIVCEQYNLDDALLDAFPYCDVISGGAATQRVNALNRVDDGWRGARP